MKEIKALINKAAFKHFMVEKNIQNLTRLHTHSGGLNLTFHLKI